MAEMLLAAGYSVFGTTRSVATAQSALPPSLTGRVELAAWNMTDQQAMVDILGRFRPHEIYNFASYSSGAGMFEDPAEIGDINGIAVVRILEAMRMIDDNIRFCQASSSEMFGDPLESPQSEQTPFNPRSPYGAAKVYAHLMIQVYRRRYGLKACSAILFNHESPRRGLNFVTRKITNAAAQIKLGLTKELCLGNLNGRRDWGFSGDYVQAMWRMALAPTIEDYIIATGETHSISDVCEIAFGFLGLDYRQYVREDTALNHSTEARQLVGNPGKLRAQLDWSPTVRFNELIVMMVSSDLQALTSTSIRNA